VREEEIDAIRRLTACEAEMEAVAEHIDEGTPISISAGSLMGLRGELVAYRSSQRVVVRIESIRQNIIVSIPLGWVEPLIKPAALPDLS
jgi:transcription antitermination factor NusG